MSAAERAASAAERAASAAHKAASWVDGGRVGWGTAWSKTHPALKERGASTARTSASTVSPATAVAPMPTITRTFSGR